MKKRIILIFIGVTIIIMCLFIINNSSMLKLKYGLDSVVILPDDIYKRYEKYPDVNFDKQFIIEVKDKKIEELHISLSDIVYLPELKQISFGILFRNNDYEKMNIPSPVFNVYLKDKNGNKYKSGGFVKNSGTFETFQTRFICDVDISAVEELTMYICPLELKESKIIEKKEIMKLIYTKDMEPLTEIKDK
ncbi:hypothetical protein SH1V18_19500 [Vallitalea longa]|uniref:Uncharacterized protein n=1 Tax=Vallitalea longa TaxID=2936439 RepID=A0A9W5Y911_9FIRM|nr:hypothetical protein [Vallitalea longa]GKX29470.1 hypothetical protein SH1V18_19500 [Vallitalea longa]